MVSKKKSLRMVKKEKKKQEEELGRCQHSNNCQCSDNLQCFFNHLGLSLSHLGALTGQIPGERVKRIVERKEKKSVIIMGNLVEFFDPRPSWCSHFIPPTNFFM